MNYLPRAKSLKKFFLYNLTFCVLLAFIVMLIDWNSLKNLTLNGFLSFFIFPLIWLIILLSIQFGYYFRDKDKIFILGNDKFTFINKSIQLTFNKHDIVKYRYTKGSWLYADITIYLQNDKKIYISNLNDDFKNVSKQLKDWNIKRRSFF
jgi:hypothetical protein